jgi:hypothetical protein
VFVKRFLFAHAPPLDPNQGFQPCPLALSCRGRSIHRDATMHRAAVGGIHRFSLIGFAV